MTYCKGRVESGIRYVRASYLRGRKAIDDLDAEQRAIALWRDETANERLHAVTRRKPCELFEEAERKALLPLPGNPCDTAHIEPSISANKYYRVHFDGNLYSVPFELAHRTGLVLRATTTEVEIYAEGKLVARHARSYGRGENVYDPGHDRGLREKRRRADRDLLLGQLVSLLGPEAERYAAGLACEHVRAALHLRRILALTERYGAAEVRQALLHVLAYEAFGADYVENALHQERRRRLAPRTSQLPVLTDEELARISLSKPDLDRFQHIA